MGEKRRDSRGRILHRGESQMKNGRYRYTYYTNGKQHALYSWRLIESDKLPKEKQECRPLRTMVAEMKNNVNDLSLADITLYEFCKRSVEQRMNLRDLSKETYYVSLKLLKKYSIANQKVAFIKKGDVKSLIRALYNDGYSFNTISIMKQIMSTSFTEAIEDELMDRNPAEFRLDHVIQRAETETTALTGEEKKSYLEFLRGSPNYSRYYDWMYALFHTGMRIGEFSGLTVDDINFVKRYINVDHQIRLASGGGYVITNSPKTKSGFRKIPMDDELYYCFKRIVQNAMANKIHVIIDGRSNFLFTTSRGNPMVTANWASMMRTSVRAYNKVHDVPLPAITPHVCRHTFCTELIHAGVNITTVQYLMGHASVGTTLSIYTHTKFDDVQQDLRRVRLS